MTQAVGQTVKGRYSEKADSREYLLYIPSRYNGQPVPLLVMLHGCTQSPEELAAGTRMNSFAEANSFLVAYPAQKPTANRAGCWNWFRPADQERGRGEPSLIAGITTQIMSSYSVDPRRVYIAGVSAGGAMSAIMGATYPDLYAAVGIHSGVPYKSAHSALSAFRVMRRGGPDPRRREAWPDTPPGSTARVPPLILFHGDSDRVVNKINARHLVVQWVTAHRREGGEPNRQPETRVVQGRAPGGHGYTRTIVCDLDGQPFVEEWIVHQAGHAWVGSGVGGPYTDTLGPDASAEMVRFFLEHPMAGPSLASS